LFSLVCWIENPIFERRGLQKPAHEDMQKDRVRCPADRDLQRLLRICNLLIGICRMVAYAAANLQSGVVERFLADFILI